MKSNICFAACSIPPVMRTIKATEEAKCIIHHRVAPRTWPWSCRCCHFRLFEEESALAKDCSAFLSPLHMKWRQAREKPSLNCYPTERERDALSSSRTLLSHTRVSVDLQHAAECWRDHCAIRVTSVSNWEVSL